jgi:hypothetical protein
VGPVCWLGTCIASLALLCVVRLRARGVRFVSSSEHGIFRSSYVAMREKLGWWVGRCALTKGGKVRNAIVLLVLWDPASEVQFGLSITHIAT